jgi:protocatechuate 3,4-dioxygenase beta subunit
MIFLIALIQQMKNHSISNIIPLLTRREALGFMGGTVAVSLLGCLRGESASVTSAPLTAQSIAIPGCIVKPQQTEGPYFVDERLNRSDIRSDPSDNSVKPGMSLRLVFRVSQVNQSACTPLPAAIVDVWHCDAGGVYSDVIDRSFNTVGRKFLRGYQVTNAAGTAEFITIYPGWYPGRTVHIHFKIRTNSTAQQSREFTSQLYFDDAITDQVHAQAPYATRGSRNRKNEQDGIFQVGGKQLLLQLTQATEGYIGRFDIGLA